jgi:hypothetical protein
MTTREATSSPIFAETIFPSSRLLADTSATEAAVSTSTSSLFHGSVFFEFAIWPVTRADELRLDLPRLQCRQYIINGKKGLLQGRKSVQASFGGSAVAESNHHMEKGSTSLRSQWRTTDPKPAVAMASNRQISRPKARSGCIWRTNRLSESILGIAFAERMDQVLQEMTRIPES